MNELVAFVATLPGYLAVFLFVLGEPWSGFAVLFVYLWMFHWITRPKRGSR